MLKVKLKKLFDALVWKTQFAVFHMLNIVQIIFFEPGALWTVVVLYCPKKLPIGRNLCR
jgi:hypothetical protein